MIELPTRPKPNAMTPAMIDRGFIQRGSSALRVDRAGNRWQVQFKYPPMRQDVADTFTAPLTRAKREGIRIYLPVRVPQGIPGSPVVDGAGQSGTSLAVSNLEVGYVARVGFWLTIVKTSTGIGYLHRMVETTVANGSGDATFEIEPPLRTDFADGDAIHIGKPFIEGFMDGQTYSYDIDSEEFTELSVTVEEY